MRTARGFTLLELVVALAVFAVLATLAYGSLARLLYAREQLASRAEALGRLQLAYSLLERDCQALVARPVRDELGDPEPPLRRAPDGSLETHPGRLEQPARSAARAGAARALAGAKRRAVPGRLAGAGPRARQPAAVRSACWTSVQRFTVGIETGRTERAVSVRLDGRPFGPIEWLFVVAGDA